MFLHVVALLLGYEHSAAGANEAASNTLVLKFHEV